MLGYKRTTLQSHDLKVTSTKCLTTYLLYNLSINWVRILRFGVMVFNVRDNVCSLLLATNVFYTLKCFIVKSWNI